MAPNGRPGDGPYADVVLHDVDVYDDQALNDLIRELSELTDDHGDVQIDGTGVGTYLWYRGRDLSAEEEAELRDRLERLVENLRERERSADGDDDAAGNGP